MHRWVFGASIMGYVVLALATSASATPSAPEIDPSGATTALGLLAGLVTLVAERFRHK